MVRRRGTRGREEPGGHSPVTYGCVLGFLVSTPIINSLLPSSFNRIDLPSYETYEKLVEKLTFAIEHTTGFFVE